MNPLHSVVTVPAQYGKRRAPGRAGYAQRSTSAMCARASGEHEGGTLSTSAVAGELVVVSSSSGVVRALRVTDGVVYVAAERAFALDVGKHARDFSAAPSPALRPRPARADIPTLRRGRSASG